MIVLMVLGSSSVTIPAGWTQIGTELTSDGGYRFKAAYRVKQSGDPTSFTGWTNCEYWLSGIWSGNDATPLVASSFATYSSTTNIPLPSLTASGVAGDAAAYLITGEGFQTFTPAANYTERGDNGQSQTVGDRLALTAGQSTSGTVVGNGADSGCVLHLIIQSSNTDEFANPHEGTAPWSSIWRPARV